MSTAVVAANESRAISRRVLAPIAIWAVLLTVPLWLPLLGGYTALAARVLVFGLAAMGLNMLLGFTGVLSFGHAAYLVSAQMAPGSHCVTWRIRRRRRSWRARCSAVWLVLYSAS